MSGHSMAYNIGFIFGSLAMVSIIFSMVFCTVRSIQTKKNLYGIPAGIIFLFYAAYCFISMLGYLDYMNLEYAIFNFIFSFVAYPLLGILILSRANKGVLMLPILLIVSITLFNNIDYWDYYSTEINISLIFYYLSMISLIVLMFARKNLKYAFFVPGVFHLVYIMIGFANGARTNIMEILLCISFFFLGKYLVSENNAQKNPVAQSPVYNVYTQQNSNTRVDISKDDELLAYKNMLNQGLITEEEYNEKKKQILGI